MIFRKAADSLKVKIQVLLGYMKHKLQSQKSRLYLGLVPVAVTAGAVGIYMTFASQASLVAPVGDCYSQAGCTDQARSAKILPLARASIPI